MNPIRRPFRYSYYNATLYLIGINVLVFILSYFRPALTSFLGISPGGFFIAHRFWQPVTYMFTHGSIMHILFNMLTLLFFGTPTEKAIGTKEFLLMYFLCGILIGLLSVTALYFLARYNVFFYYYNLIGASGAIYTLLLVYAVIFPKAKIFIWGILPVPAPLLIVIYFVIELVSQFSSVSNTAHYAHLLGLLLGWLYLVIRMGIHPVKVWIEAYRRR
ncbi:MAG: rhomboid family intramembrane serine protease [Treponema sp.]|nr:rhomboid family intramembrane serine protease [Treponema sp.]MBP5752524.1 rhomboid family intramembrane serine protease [Treponema sp.]MBR4005250.1 rhomboid family intramembrane serine protease [Treponema sp.]